MPDGVKERFWQGRKEVAIGPVCGEKVRSARFPNQTEGVGFPTEEPKPPD